MYRGYYYDFESNLYYLNSRYYDPEIGRFINADDISVLSSTKDVLNGLNLYAYCLNNHINSFDENGNIPNWLIMPDIIRNWYYKSIEEHNKQNETINNQIENTNNKED